MKKFSLVITSALLILSLGACTAAPTAVETAAAPESSEAVTAAPAQTAAASAETVEESAPGMTGMVNPMVEVDDPAYFQKELDIRIDTAQLPSESKLFIIDSKVADIRFDITSSIEGKVECTLRATRDEEASKSMSGIYDALNDAGDIEFIPAEGEPFTIRHEISNDGLITLYSFKAGNTWYTLCLQGNPSYEDNRYVLYSVMRSIGIEPDEEAMADNWYELNEAENVLTVRLAANATTGYEWTYRIWDETTLEPVAEEYVPGRHEEGMTGYGGTWVASFAVAGEKEGSNYISFTYARPGTAEIPSKVLDLEIGGGTMAITGVHEPDFSQYPSEDGEFDNVDIYFNNMVQENETSFYAIVDVSMDKHITVHFTNETEVVDKIEEALKTGNTGTIYDKLRDYLNVKAKVVVKDGEAKSLTIYD